MKNLSYLYLAFVLSLTASGCSDGELVSLSGQVDASKSDDICFSPSAPAWADNGSSRASWNSIAYSPDLTDSLYVTSYVSDYDAPASRGDITAALSSFGVTAAIKGSDAQKYYYFFNKKNSVTTDGKCTFADGAAYAWPGSGYTFDFYAVAPYLSDSDVKQATDGVPTLSYTVPAAAADQKDILVAQPHTNIKGDTKTVMPLTFDHVCTAVQFVSKVAATGTIKKITLKGINNTGTYSLGGSAWTLGSSTADFALELSDTEGTMSAGNTLTPGSNCFIMLPQTLGNDAKLEIEYYENVTDKTRTLTASLAGQNWEKGKIVKYNISVSPDYIITLENLPEAVDAHYVISTLKVTAPDGVDINGKNWTLTVDNGASLLFKSDANDYIKQGIWTDRIYNKDDGSDIGSARGENSLTGTSANFGDSIYVMIPENATGSDRNITLTLSVNGTSVGEYKIPQYCPDDNGWERIDASDAVSFGFNWDRKVYYTYVYTAATLINQTYKNICQTLIDENNAGSYASVGYFKYYKSTFERGYRYYIYIDYALLNNIENNTADDGLSNTVSLNSKAGSASSNTFETIIQNTKKTESGKTSENAFRIGNDADYNNGSNSTEAPGPTGTIDNSSAALGECLKKNRYNLVKTSVTITVDGKQVTNVAYSHKIADSDIVWYMPAVDEFSTLPSNKTKSDYWSSTVVSEESSAYNGAGTAVARSEKLKIYAKRVTTN